MVGGAGRGAEGWGWWLAAGAAAGSILGGATGGIIGALVAGGVPEADAHVYSEGLRRGGTLVTVRVDDARADQAKAILDDNDSVDIADRRTALERDGWSEFDADAASPTTAETPRRDSTRPPVV